MFIGEYNGGQKIVIPSTSKLLFFSSEQVTNENPSNNILLPDLVLSYSLRI